MPEKMAAAALKSLLDAQGTCALIDVREPGEYNDAHIPGASLVPRRQLEYRMTRLVPFAGTQVIVCDDDGRRAPRPPSSEWDFAGWPCSRAASTGGRRTAIRRSGG